MSATVAFGAVLVSACFDGCGAGAADPVVVDVGHASIRQSMVKHWMGIVAGEVSTAPGHPKPEVPVPPQYTECISYKRKYPVTPPNGRSTASRGQLRRECEFEFRKEKLKALYFLISSLWVSGAASELGVNPDASELKRRIVLFEQQFPSLAIARRFLVGTRGTEIDLRAHLKVVVLTLDIQRKLEAQSRQKGLGRAERQLVLDRFGERFQRTWRARTNCRPGYMTPICQQYRTPNVSPAITPPTVPLTKMTAE
jgi:hypothetical protein